MVENHTARGVRLIQTSQTIWGKIGRILVISGLAVMRIIQEIDNTTTGVYSSYIMSEFGTLSTLGTLGTASTIVFAVVMLPIAKISDIIGRGYTLATMVALYTVAYTVMASASGINSYLVGAVFCWVGKSGINIIINVIISDITSARWRGLALGLSYFPFVITPWISGFIVDSVVKGIGWRWGLGMFAILMPVGASVVIGALLYYQYRAEKDGSALFDKTTIRGFCSDIDLGGITLFTTGFTLLLLPISMAGSLTEGWRTSWIIALIVIGFVVLLTLPVYERFMATNPVLPVFYLRNATIALSVLIIAIDSLGHSATHAYLYPWATVSHNMSARIATFYIFTNNVTQCLAGIIGGWAMLLTGRYKLLVLGGALIRLLGYGLMIRLRGQQNSIGELFAQQIVQGVGSGIIQTCLLVPPQIVVPHAQISQVLSLAISMSLLGSSVGFAIAGGIYTNTLRSSLWAHLGGNATQKLVDELYNSITGVLPAWETPERDAVNLAFTDVTKSFAYASLGGSILVILMCCFLPDLLLPEDHPSIGSGNTTGVTGVSEEEFKEAQP